MIEFRQVTTGYGNTVAVKDITFSPIKGPEGNIEYLGLLEAGGEGSCPTDLAALVDQSHSVWMEGEA